MNKYPPAEVTLPWVDPARPNLTWEDRPTRTVRLLVTTARTSGLSGGAVNRGTFDDKQWKPALIRAGVIPPPTITDIPGKKHKSVVWNMPRGDGFHVLRHIFASVVLHSRETVAKLAE